jgi:hypothetical protein
VRALYLIGEQRYAPERAKTKQSVEDAQVREQRLKEIQEQLAKQRVAVTAYEAYQTQWEQKLAGYGNAQQVLNRARNLAENPYNLQVMKLKSGESITVEKRAAVKLEVEVVGAFSDILGWLGQLEADADGMRHVESSWRPQTAGRLSLTVVFAMEDPSKGKL